MHILQTHWDIPPFHILRDNETLVSADHALKRSFEIKVHKESIDMINKFVRSEQSGGSYNVHSFAVDKETFCVCTNWGLSLNISLV